MNRYLAPMIALALFVAGGLLYWVQQPADVILATTNVKPVRPLEMRAVLSLSSGDVLMSKDGNEWNKASQGQVLKAKYQVRTGNGQAAIIFDGAGTLRLDRRSIAEIVEMTNKSIAVRVLDGRVYNSLKDLPGVAWRVEALGATVTASGTAYAVAADEVERRVTVHAVKHDVDLQIGGAVDGKIVKIAEGTRADVDLTKPADQAASLSPLSRSAMDADEFLQWNAGLDEAAGQQPESGAGAAADEKPGVGALRAGTAPIPE